MSEERIDAERRADATVSLQLDKNPLSARMARKAMQRLLGDDPPIMFVRDAMLLTSELVSNAVMHTDNGCELIATYRSAPDWLRVEVRDLSSELPRRAESADPATPRRGGLGLRLIDQMAAHWGASPRSEGGKTVWFEMAT
ncbi:MAG: ATP-binding protein [Ilumatobacteraceae bacterium]